MTEPFDVCGPLPTGVTVLEASAGTGKTWTIAALAARYVAEGTPLKEILLVTFTRMATGELRDRVRERLVFTEQALARVLAGEPPADDPMVRLLAREDVQRRRDRLAGALTDFDAATVATIHGFCQEALGGLGVAAEVEGELVEDPTDLVNEVVDDLYVRRFLREDRPPITRDEAGRVARIAVENPAAPIEPRDAAEHSPAAMRRRLAEAVRGEFAVRKKRTGVLTYDDLLTELDAILSRDPAEVERLRRRWKVVLVDEFQDTDPVQWSIMRRTFGDGTLVLIGDPKQAIYAFRGADVYAYLDAAGAAGTEATLDTNRRSDQGLIDAYDALFAGARLGHEGIVYRHVKAARAGRGLPGVPLRVRVVQRGDVRKTARGYAELPSVRDLVARDLAADLASLLSGGEVEPGQVAVLVQTNRNAARVREALDDAGIPAVINGAGSVFGTVEAGEWLRLLEALERPTSELRARSAALTPFFGWTAERVAAAGDEEWEDVHRRLHDWARVLRLWGVASLVETITVAEGLPERVLGAANGERRLTDLRHVGELLHAEQLGTTALTGWLRRRIAEAGQDTGDEDRSRRLESDAEAVQVLTVHRSKGLEFPVVYFPDLFEPGYIPERVPVTFHDEDGVRTIDVGMTGPEFNRHRDQHVVEQRGEDLRIAYVALTRAKHQAVLWWAPTFGSRDSSLGRLLFARAEDGTIPAKGRDVPTDEAAWQRFESLAAAAPGCIAVERALLGLPLGYAGPPREPAELSAAVFDRPLDQRWRRTSFTDLSAGAHEARVGSEPEERVLTDEPEGPPVVAGELPLAAMPAGAEIGTFVHRVLEATDFAAADLDAELARRISEVQARRAVEIGDGAAVTAGLRAAIETPLGDLLGGAALRDVRREDRLDELDFELPLVGGDDPTGGLVLEALGEIAGAALPSRLADPALRADVRGYLTGSIDLVVRAGERFAIFDYKTNWLGAPGEDLTAGHYRPEALAAEMERAHYGLQALLYQVALHRYLRWRLPGYDPDRHLAGVGYLFLRGMTGSGGVFAWRPPGAVVEALSDVLDRGVAVTALDPFDARIAARAPGVLRDFNVAGVLAPADVHVARRLAAIAGETSEAVMLAAALAVRGPRLGHVYVDLATIRDTATVDAEEPVDLSELPWPEDWLAAVEASPLVAVGEEGGAERPLRLVGSALYLDRYWREERQVAADLVSLRASLEIDEARLGDGLARLFDDDRQRQAAETAVRRRLAVVAGGPGTGKTTTVARILALLLEQGADPSLIALAAPTGKAAARLSEAVHEEAARLDISAAAREQLLGLDASTLHRLLGWRPGTHSRFRHDRSNRLPHDAVIVDETSMVSLSLMARLVEAVRPTARLILVGDPGQLTSIEAGAVLGDIVAADDGIVVLDRVHRYGGAIAGVAEAIRRGDGDAVIEALGRVGWTSDLEVVRERAVVCFRAVAQAARTGDGTAAIAALGGFRILCAHRRGPHGVTGWTAQVEAWLAAAGLAPDGDWYAGRPLLVTENDYGLGLYNGDTGVVIADEDRLTAVFERRGELAGYSPARLGAVDSVYAMTVHKSQGSQFDTAAVLLPDAASPILTRELLYTAVTRARSELILVGSEEAIRAAVARPVARASGLARRLRT